MPLPPAGMGTDPDHRMRLEDGPRIARKLLTHTRVPGLAEQSAPSGGMPTRPRQACKRSGRRIDLGTGQAVRTLQPKIPNPAGKLLLHHHANSWEGHRLRPRIT